MKEPLVTVVVPCYNHERYVQECLQSIIDQEHKNIELIIIDDGSQDNSVKKIQELLPACKDRFERCEFRSRPNKGLSATLNEALELTHGKYFSTVGSDDILYSDKLTKQVALFEKADERCAGIFGGVEFVDEFSRRIKVKNISKKKMYYFKDVFLRNSFLPAPSALLLTEKIRNIGGYNKHLSIEDFYIWLKMLEGGDYFVNTGEVIVKYRRHGDNYSNKTEEMWACKIKILENYKNIEIYKKGLAASMLVHANSLQGYDRKIAVKYLLSALYNDRALIFSSKLYKHLLKYLLL